VVLEEELDGPARRGEGTDHGASSAQLVLQDLVTIHLRGDQTDGRPHTYRAGDAGARALVQTSPAGFEAFVEKTSRPAETPGLPRRAGPPTPEQAAHLAAVAAEHGIDTLGAPGTRP
jgi:hypothetical protein